AEEPQGEQRAMSLEPPGPLRQQLPQGDGQASPEEGRQQRAEDRPADPGPYLEHGPLPSLEELLQEAGDRPVAAAFAEYPLARGGVGGQVTQLDLDGGLVDGGFRVEGDDASLAEPGVADHDDPAGGDAAVVDEDDGAEAAVVEVLDVVAGEAGD